MGSFSHGIAEAIRRMGDAQAQGALQKGAVYGNLAHDLGQAPMQYLAIDRGLHENKYRQTMQAAQEKKLKDDQEFEALINQAPETDRLKVSLEFWRGRDMEKYDAIVRAAQQAASQAFAAKQGTEGQPTLTPDPVSGEPTQLDNMTHHDPITFPGGPGQPSFTATPQSRSQVQSQTGMQNYINELQKEAGKRAGGGGLDAAANRALTEREGVLNRQNRLDVAQLPKQDNSINPYEDFRSPDPTKRKNAEDYLNRQKQAGGEKTYGQKQFVTIYDEKSGMPKNYWVDPVKKTIEEAPVSGARTEPRDIAGGSQAILQSVDVSLPVLKELETDLKVLDSGPLKGRLAQFSLSNLGGAGLGPKEVAIRTKLGRLTADQIFGEGGKQLTGTEKAMIEPFVLNQEDTLQTALAKLPELRIRLQRIKQSRVSMMNPRTRAVHSDLTDGETPAPTGGGGTNRRISDKSDEELQKILSGK